MLIVLINAFFWAGIRYFYLAHNGLDPASFKKHRSHFCAGCPAEKMPYCEWEEYRFTQLVLYATSGIFFAATLLVCILMMATGAYPWRGV